jgi:ribosomal protein S18 acetylase RimI-like enzyme
MVMLMFALNIENDGVYFKDIRFRDLLKVLEWYNNTDDYKFATGIGEPVTIELLRQKYAESLISRNEFFVGIYSKVDHKMIGIIKGRIHSGTNGEIWINSMIIDSAYQNIGIGSSSIRLLLKYFRDVISAKSVLLSVIESNTRGVRFWAKQGFSTLRRIEEYVRLRGEDQNVLIMRKDL